MASNPAALALDGGDPRKSSGDAQTIAPAAPRLLHDPNVMLEEYLYYAKIQREQEAQGLGPEEREALYRSLAAGNSPDASDEKKEVNEKAPVPTTTYSGPAPAEWETASRAARNAKWSAVVYLITTDILGPSNAPWAISQFGYVGGVITYTFMGLMAFFAGWQIWRMFLKLDSDRYPMRTFGDLGFRIYGTWTRHGMNILQSIQLLFNVGVIIIGNGQALSQISKYKLCYAVCILIFPLAGMIAGQIRTLQKFGYLANFAIWLNVLVIIFTMAVACHSLPNYSAAFGVYGTPKGPVEHTVWIPSGSTFDSQLQAAMQIVYAYGGAMLYCEFMAEMKRPMDFIKAQFIAEMFIYLCYLIFGLVLYSQQGQFTFNPANQGLSPYSWQTATNAINIVSGLIAAVLYGNIGIKVVYQNIVQDILGGPELHSKKGKIIWVAMVPLYWFTAYILASAVPNFNGISSMVSAVCIMQFTYTFPTILYFGLQLQTHAITPEETFDPATGVVHRIDSWKDFSRWKRGFKRMWWMKIFCLAFFFASCATAVLGMYASVKSIKAAFDSGHATAFSCHSPLDG